ncbi:MAG: DUF1116 domain-containing protein [Chloroflexi bacterium]|nr:DUF1116 domain-containing protein [Chloroflexota bacterium]
MIARLGVTLDRGAGEARRWIGVIGLPFWKKAYPLDAFTKVTYRKEHRRRGSSGSGGSAVYPVRLAGTETLKLKEPGDLPKARQLAERVGKSLRLGVEDYRANSRWGRCKVCDPDDGPATCANAERYDHKLVRSSLLKAMAAGKATMDPVGGIQGTTIVSAMSRNGRDFGIRVGGAGSQWFSAPALMPQGLYFPGYTAADANPDMGDSSIIETMGLGGFAMGGAPAVVGFVGAGTFRDAMDYTLEMDEITEGRHDHFVMPTMDSRGVPCGIDVRKVVETGIAPVINTGIAHRMAGVGQVGAGIVRAPMECFTQALEALAERISSPSDVDH